MWHSVSYWVRWVDNCNYFHNSWNIYYVTQCQLTGKMVWQFQHFCGILQYSFTFMLYTFLTAALSLWLCLFCCGHCSLFCGGFAVALFPGVVFCGRCFRGILCAAGMCLLTVRAKRALACRKQMAGPKGPPVRPASEASPSVPSTIPTAGRSPAVIGKKSNRGRRPRLRFLTTMRGAKQIHRFWPKRCAPLVGVCGSREKLQKRIFQNTSKNTVKPTFLKKFQKHFWSF